MKTRHIIAALALMLLSFSARAGSVWAVSVGGTWGGGSVAIAAGNGCTTPYWGGQAVVGYYPPTPVLPAPYYPPTPVYPVGTVAVAAPGVAVTVGSTWAVDAFVSPWLWSPFYTGYSYCGPWAPGYSSIGFAWYGGSSCNRNDWNNCDNGNNSQTYRGQGSRSYQGSPQGRQQPATQQAFSSRAERTASFGQANPQRVNRVENPVPLERPSPAAGQLNRSPQWRNQASSPEIAQRTRPTFSQVAPQRPSPTFRQPSAPAARPEAFNQAQAQRPVAFNNANSQVRGLMANIPARSESRRNR